MTELASPGQLRAALLRWSIFLAPLLLLLGSWSGLAAGSGSGNLWFMGLEKPAIYPPPATFGIVWTVLYLLMGVALAMIVTARGAAGRGGPSSRHAKREPPDRRSRQAANSAAGTVAGMGREAREARASG
jgi:hypothetical protein